MRVSFFVRLELCPVCFLLVLLAVPVLGQGSKVPSSTTSVENVDEDNPLGRDLWFHRGREPLPGHNAAELRYRAHQQKMELRRLRARQAAMTIAPSALTTAWLSLGPAPLQSNAGTGQDYGLVTGRANAVAIDPADPTGNTVYVGRAFGGLWRSTNAANPTPSAVTWTPLTDDQPTLSFGAIAIQPGNKTGNLSNVILVGTGESNAAIDSYYGLDFLRSANAGSTWTLIPTANNGTLSLKGLAVARMAFSAASTNTVVAAITGSSIGVDNGVSGTLGIYVSTDAGLTWTHQPPTDNGAPISANSATSVVYNTTAGRFYAAIRYHGIYSSTNGITWARLPTQPGAGLTTSACPTNGATTCPMFRGELAVVPGMTRA